MAHPYEFMACSQAMKSSQSLTHIQFAHPSYILVLYTLTQLTVFFLNRELIVALPVDTFCPGPVFQDVFAQIRIT